MAEDWENSIKTVAQSLANALKDAAKLSVQTEFIEPATSGGAQATPIVLTTTIKLDGDSNNAVPVRRVAGAGLDVNTPLHQIHENNVRAAMEYRTRILSALLNAVQARFR